MCPRCVPAPFLGSRGHLGVCSAGAQGLGWTARGKGSETFEGETGDAQEAGLLEDHKYRGRVREDEPFQEQSQLALRSGSQTSFCRIPQMGAAPKSFTQIRMEGAHICKEVGVTFTSCTF